MTSANRKTGGARLGPLSRCAVLRDLRALCGEEGLTLIEILIAMFIFLIGILGILAVFPVAMNSAGRTIGETRSNVLAQTVLAQVSADWKSPYFSGMVASAPNAGTLTVTGTVPANLVGCFVTMISTPTCNTDPAIGQSRVITSIISPSPSNSANTDLLVCPDLNPAPLGTPTPPDTTPSGFIITKLALPSYPVGTVTANNGTNIQCNLTCRANQWDGYYLVFTKVLSRNWIGISRQIVLTHAPVGGNSQLDLDPTQQAVDTSSAGVVAGDQFAIVDGGYNVTGTGQSYTKSRSGYIMKIDSSVPPTTPNTPNDSIDVGRLDPTDPAGQHVIPLSWSPAGISINLWFKPALVSAAATSGTLNKLTNAGAVWTPSGPGPTSTYGPPSDFRGCMAVIVNDGNKNLNGTPKYAFLIANQARLITWNDAQNLYVFPNWTLPAGWNNATDWANVQFIILEQPGNYFLVITSGKAAGRVLPITGFVSSPGGTAPNGSDRITCLFPSGLDFRSLGVKDAWDHQLPPNDHYFARNADTFTIIGVNGYPNSAYVAYTAPIDAAHPAPPYSAPANASNPLLYPCPYELNAFGYPGVAGTPGVADRQTRSDVQTATLNPSPPPTYAPEAQTSDYGYACIFSGTGSLSAGPARADIFVFHNFNSALPVVNNQKPVGYLAGYIKRP